MQEACKYVFQSKPEIISTYNFSQCLRMKIPRFIQLGGRKTMRLESPDQVLEGFPSSRHRINHLRGLRQGGCEMYDLDHLAI